MVGASFVVGWGAVDVRPAVDMMRRGCDKRSSGGALRPGDGDLPTLAGRLTRRLAPLPVGDRAPVAIAAVVLLRGGPAVQVLGHRAGTVAFLPLGVVPGARRLAVRAVASVLGVQHVAASAALGGVPAHHATSASSSS